VADTCDAMTTTRPYRKALTKEEACAELLALRDRQWDGRMVEAFLSGLERGNTG